MRFPEEVVVEDVLPTLRALLADALEGHGLSQDQVAQRLGLSQAAVSKYRLGKVPRNPVIERDARVRRVVEEVAAGMAEDALGPVDALARLRGLLAQLENRGAVCKLHEAQMPALRGLGCDLCVGGEGGVLAQEHEVLANLRMGIRVLERAPGLAGLIPAVGSNLAMALPGAREPLDVAAIPGRIDEVDGAVKVPGLPEFGASRTVARVVLAVLEQHPQVRAAMNLRNGPDVQQAAKKLGLRLAAFDAEHEGDRARMAAAVGGIRAQGMRGDRTRAGGTRIGGMHVGGASAGEMRKAVPDGLHHPGAFGVEPALYLLGEDAVRVAKQAARLAAAMGKAA